MPKKMIMTETGTSDDANRTTPTPLPVSPNSENNNGGVKAMDVDIDLTEDSNSPEAVKNNGVGDKGTGAFVPPSPSCPSTPKTPGLKSSVDCFRTPEPSTPTSSSSAKKRKRLTPDEKNQREKERQEKRRKLEEEKQKKEEERLEKARQKEAERVKKEEEKKRQEEEKKREREKKEEEKKRFEEEKRLDREKKEEERLKKEEERKRLEEEKRLDREKKEEERLKKEEERKKKEDERKQKLEEKEKELKKIEEKKAKQAQFFTNFFQKSSTPKQVKTADDCIVYPSGTGGKVASVVTNNQDGEKASDGEPVAAVVAEASKDASLFTPLPFQIKTGMAVAPVCRREKLTDRENSALDALFGIPHSPLESEKKSVSHEAGFLKRLKEGKGRRHGKTEVKEGEADVQILDDDNADKPKNLAGYIKWRVKLLQFHDNRRPAYWGTWKRKGKKISARRPLAQEEDLDYEFDSDDEWEDEPEDAEEIENSDKEETEEQEEAEGEDDEEGWMVPHGYLSDTEREGTGGDMESMKNKEKEFYKSLKEKTLIGLPFIETHDLSCFTIRICPVFKSADPVKPVRKRSKPAKKEVKDTEQTKAEKEIVQEDASAAATKEGQRKGIRKRKAPDTSNPYAKPPSGFLALDLPSDDEEDMDWDDDDSSTSSGTSGDDESSGVDEAEDLNNDEGAYSFSSGSEDDLFVPVKVPQNKKSPPPS